LLLFPLWLLIYYFKDRITYFLIFSLCGLSEGNQFPNASLVFSEQPFENIITARLIIFVMGVIRSFFSRENQENFGRQAIGLPEI